MWSTEGLRKVSELWWLSVLTGLNLGLVSNVPVALAAVTVLAIGVAVLAWPVIDLLTEVLG